MKKVIDIIKKSTFGYNPYEHRMKFAIQGLDICLFNYKYSFAWTRDTSTLLTKDEIIELNKIMIKYKLKGIYDFEWIVGSESLD